eukprot:TRINITY_DN1430_c0_g1_i1.p1 TRINITY_DN1430_c0_g1~~TRINITY_DN1430_c0_g1_i1.p1  ORF type:complete len:160 (+),score=36.24 TRINITY_DN1430_c0_g1_i1:29-481(+)
MGDLRSLEGGWLRDVPECHIKEPTPYLVLFGAKNAANSHLMCECTTVPMTEEESARHAAANMLLPSLNTFKDAKAYQEAVKKREQEAASNPKPPDWVTNPKKAPREQTNSLQRFRDCFADGSGKRASLWKLFLAKLEKDSGVPIASSLEN